MELSLQRLARNQALFREVNDRIIEIKSPAVSYRELICECSAPTCTKSLAVAMDEYNAVRSDSGRFLVARGHEIPEIEVVVEDKDRFLVVEKKVETEFLAETDSRSSPGEGA